MPQHIVKRHYGKNSDFLTGWCDTWGTVCMGSPAKALKFDKKSDAENAAARAQMVCRGVDGPAKGMTFKAHQLGM